MLDHVRISATETDEAVTIAVQGELDVLACSDLETLLEAVGTRPGEVVVDLAGVTFAHSRALSVLVRAHRALASRDQQLVVAAPSAPVRRLLALSGWAAELTVRDRSHRRVRHP